MQTGEQHGIEKILADTRTVQRATLNLINFYGAYCVPNKTKFNIHTKSINGVAMSKLEGGKNKSMLKIEASSSFTE